MIPAFSPTHRIRTLVLFVLAAAMAIGATLVGIEDNVVGIALAMLSVAALVVAIVHPWRSRAQFLGLVRKSVIAFFGLLLLGVPMAILGDTVVTSGPLSTILGFVSTAFMLFAGFVCIPALVVGIIGTILMRGRREPAAAGDDLDR